MTNKTGLEFIFCENQTQGLIAPTEYARLKIAQLERELKDWTHALEVLNEANSGDKHLKCCGECKGCKND